MKNEFLKKIEAAELEEKKVFTDEDIYAIINYFTTTEEAPSQFKVDKFIWDLVSTSVLYGYTKAILDLEEKNI